MEERDETLFKATSEANELFGRLAESIRKRAESDDPIDVLEVVREAGLEIDEGVLRELRIPQLIPPIRFVPWHVWWPWRPLWCWWWRRYYPWHNCCPYWWHRCYWW